ncbi:MAG: BTAD domain-containing putative transcriptional regulator [Longimicrobiales bacterium]
MATLRLLGGIDLKDHSGKEALPLLSQPKRMAVFVYLALQGRGRYLQRDDILSLFWAESESAPARNALNQVLYAFRKELGEGILRARGKSEVALDLEWLTCDVWDFRDAAADGRYEEALGLYAGPLLPGFHVNGDSEFERWLEEERETLRETAARAAWALAHRHITSGALVEAERTAQRALALVWSDETPVRDFIAALATAGDRAAAMRFYGKFCDRLKEELDVEPSAHTVEVAEAIRTGNQKGPPAPSQTSPPWVEGNGEGTSPGRGIPDPGREAKSPPLGPPSNRMSWARSRVWWWAGGAVAAALVLVDMRVSQPPPAAGPPPPDRPYTMLAGVAGNTGEEERDAVAFLLRTGLEVSHVVQTVPPADVDHTLSLMEHPEGRPLDEAAAREVAIRMGVPTVVVPRLDRLGDTYSLTFRVEDAATGYLHAAAQGRVADVAGVVPLVDDLILELRRKMGEAKEVLTQSQPLPQVLTPSLVALREYQLAEEAGPGQARIAVAHLRRAVATDTAFAMAWQLMASYYRYLNQPDSANMARRQVERFGDRLTEARRRDLLLHRRMREDVALWDLALEDAEQAVLRDSRYLNNYSVYTAVPGGLPDSALNIRFRLEREGVERARRFDPDRPHVTRCFINTHYSAAALDRMDEWLALLDSLDIGLPPDCGREAALFEGLAARQWDRVDSMVQHGPGDWRWPTVVETALLQMVPLRGGIRAAHAFPILNNPETKALRPDSSTLSDVAHLLLQVAYGLPLEEAPEEKFGQRGTPRELGDRGRDEVTRYVLYGARESLLGDTLEARRVAGRLKAMRDSATSRTFEGAFGPWFALMEAGPAYQRQDWPAAIQVLQPVVTRIHEPKVGYLGGDDYLLFWVLAEAHTGLGDLQAAARHLEAILERPRYRRDNWMLQGFIHPAARFKLAGLYVQMGNARAAREQYRIFLDTFTDPEPDFQWMVGEARRGLAAAR